MHDYPEIQESGPGHVCQGEYHSHATLICRTAHADGHCDATTDRKLDRTWLVDPGAGQMKLPPFVDHLRYASAALQQQLDRFDLEFPRVVGAFLFHGCTSLICHVKNSFICVSTKSGEHQCGPALRAGSSTSGHFVGPRKPSKVRCRRRRMEDAGGSLVVWQKADAFGRTNSKKGVFP